MIRTLHALPAQGAPTHKRLTAAVLARRGLAVVAVAAWAWASAGMAAQLAGLLPDAPAFAAVSVIPWAVLGLYACAAVLAAREDWPTQVIASFVATSLVLATGAPAIAHPATVWVFAAAMCAGPPLMLHKHALLLSVGRRPGRTMTVMLVVMYGVAALLAAPLLWVPIDELRALPRYSAWRIGLYVAMMAAFALSMVYTLATYRREAAPTRRRGVRLILFANLLAPLPVVLLFALPSMLGSPFAVSPELTLVGLLLVPAAYIYVVLAMPRTHKIDARAQSAATVYLLMLLAASGFVFGATLVERVVGHALTSSDLILISVVMFLVAWSVRPFLARFVRWLWHGRELPPTALMQWLASSLAVSLDKEAFRTLLTRALVSKMSLSGAAVYIAHPDGGFFLEAGAGSDQSTHAWPAALPDGGDIVRLLRRTGEPVETRGIAGAERLSHDELQLLRQPGRAWLVPLQHDDALLGLLWVSRETGNDWYTSEDVSVFAALGRQAGLTLRNIGLVSEIEHQRAQLIHANGQLIAEREKERNRIARDLHDIVLQRAIGLNYQIKLQRMQIAADDAAVPDADSMLDTVGHALRDLSRDIRGVIVDLRPMDWDASGLEKALREYVAHLAQTLPHLRVPAIHYAVEKLGWGYSEHIMLALFRIAQEAVRNAIWHADAKNVTVGLRRKDGCIELSISDDGRGLDHSLDERDLARHNHFGMIGMRERCGLIGGVLDVSAAPGRGVTILARVPLELGQ